MASAGTSPSPAQGPAHLHDDLRSHLTTLGWWVSSPFTTVRSHWLAEGEQRLDASYYAGEVFAAQRILGDCGYEVRNLGQLTREVFTLGRFRRVYADGRSSGWPYLSASDALAFRPESDRWIARDHAPKPAARHFAQRGWMLLSCSGSVGRTVLVTPRLEQFFLTHDLARLVPAEWPPVGYLYAYLSSWIGQALLSKDQYGGPIKHLEPHHIAGVPVPLVCTEEQQAIHEQIIRAYTLRDEANDLLDDAGALLRERLQIPAFDEALVPYLPAPRQTWAGQPPMPHPRAFAVSASELGDRLDASYHVPVARTVVALLRGGCWPLARLGDLADSIVLPPRFKRIYVTKVHGVPFLRPSHLPEMRPHDLGHIARRTPELDALLLNYGDVLVTTDGTVGRVAVVSSYIAGWAGSNNIARITYGHADGCNGYLAAFLSSPYGRHQMMREIYGGVVDHIEVANIEGVLVPTPPTETQAEVGRCVVQAFERKDEASRLEEEAIHRLEALLDRRDDER